MKISYKKLWVTLTEKEMSKAEFRDNLELSTGTMTKPVSYTHLDVYKRQ